MPKKQVVEYTCERCARVWYLDSKEPEPPAKLKLLLELGRDKATAQEGASISYECLCESCTETVQSLVKSLAPLKPRQPRAKKKDESKDQGNPQSSDPTTTTDAAPGAAPNVASSPAQPASGGSTGGAVVRPTTPSTPPHPKR